MGHKLKPNEPIAWKEKIESVVMMSMPACKADVQRFLGVVKCLGKYIDNL